MCNVLVLFFCRVDPDGLGQFQRFGFFVDESLRVFFEGGQEGLRPFFDDMLRDLLVDAKAKKVKDAINRRLKLLEKENGDDDQ